MPNDPAFQERPSVMAILYSGAEAAAECCAIPPASHHVAFHLPLRTREPGVTQAAFWGKFPENSGCSRTGVLTSHQSSLSSQGNLRFPASVLGLCMPSNLYLESQSLAFRFQLTQDSKPVPCMALIAVQKYLVPKFGGGLERVLFDCIL